MIDLHIAARWRSWFGRSDVSMFYDFVPPPYGGANQFLRALWGELASCGLRLENNSISPTTRACLFNSNNFHVAGLRSFKRPTCRMVHRVDGPISVYRGTDDAVDRRILEFNREFADATVFQSQYSLRKHAEMGLAFKQPTVILNAVDSRIFFPLRQASLRPGAKIRLISTSWSDNPNKGTATYAWLDAHLDWARFEYTFVGRMAVPFKRIKTIAPVDSHRLAALLREHDIYVTASRHDPCSNALLEALSCGLPAAYVDSGGHPELAGEGGLPFTEPEQITGVLDSLVRDYEWHRAHIAIPSIAGVADQYLRVMGL